MTYEDYKKLKVGDIVNFFSDDEANMHKKYMIGKLFNVMNMGYLSRTIFLYQNIMMYLMH